MKGAIAAFVAAVERFLGRRGRDFGGSISLLITGDEEGPAINGTAKVLGWLRQRRETLDACIVGEPTNPRHLGEVIKIGRRGSLSGRITVTGVQGHTAYPQNADNPLPRLVRMLDALARIELDPGTPHFQPSNLQLTTIDVGNPATNVIPGRASAGFNVRYNDLHTSKTLEALIRRTLDGAGGEYELEIQLTGEAFLTAPGNFTALIADQVARLTNRKPELNTLGGTSDARFIKDCCPVCEFGAIGETMHKTDERIALADLLRLVDIYDAVLERYFTR
jgi:succinyl-diaminopimelate desuccinylase